MTRTSSFPKSAILRKLTHMRSMSKDIDFTFTLRLPFWKKNIDIHNKVEYLSTTYHVKTECQRTGYNLLFVTYRVRLKGDKKSLKFVIGLL